MRSGGMIRRTIGEMLPAGTEIRDGIAREGMFPEIFLHEFHLFFEEFLEILKGEILI